MITDDFTIGVHFDWLTEAELVDKNGDSMNRSGIDSRIPVAWSNPAGFPPCDIQPGLICNYHLTQIPFRK